ncbi:hypothetical protein CBL_01016 [Carabus blaptoides fortunei]
MLDYFHGVVSQALKHEYKCQQNSSSHHLLPPHRCTRHHTQYQPPSTRPLPIILGEINLKQSIQHFFPSKMTIIGASLGPLTAQLPTCIITQHYLCDRRGATYISSRKNNEYSKKESEEHFTRSSTYSLSCRSFLQETEII